MFKNNAAVLLGLAVILGAGLQPALARGQNVHTLLKNGPDSQKRVIAIVGDGYTQADLSKYEHDVNRLVIDGLFEQDPVFRRNISAFNVYRIDVTSNESGVSQRTYDINGTPSDSSDDVLTSETLRDTALGYIYTGVWAQCWFQDASDTVSRLNNLLSDNLQSYDYVLVVLNESNFGGCKSSNRMVVTAGSSWNITAHEMGHMVGGLHDEYSIFGKGDYPDNLNSKNCSTELDRSTVVWGDLIDPAMPVPTTFDATTMDTNTTVGMFEGCKTYETDVYRPAFRCRMNNNNPDFCPVCARLMDSALECRSSVLTFPRFEIATRGVTTASSARCRPRSGTFDRAFDNAPPSMCVAANGASLTVRTDGQVANQTSQSITVVCPAERTTINSLISRRFWGWVWVMDRHPTQEVCCRVQSKNPGGALRSGPQICSNGAHTGYQKLPLPMIYDPYTWSHFTIQCTMPPSNNGAHFRILTFRSYQDR